MKLIPVKFEVIKILADLATQRRAFGNHLKNSNGLGKLF